MRLDVLAKLLHHSILFLQVSVMKVKKVAVGLNLNVQQFKYKALLHIPITRNIVLVQVAYSVFFPHSEAKKEREAAVHGAGLYYPLGTC